MQTIYKFKSDKIEVDITTTTPYTIEVIKNETNYILSIKYELYNVNDGRNEYRFVFDKFVGVLEKISK